MIKRIREEMEDDFFTEVKKIVGNCPTELLTIYINSDILTWLVVNEVVVEKKSYIYMKLDNNLIRIDFIDKEDYEIKISKYKNILEDGGKKYLNKFITFNGEVLYIDVKDIKLSESFIKNSFETITKQTIKEFKKLRPLPGLFIEDKDIKINMNIESKKNMRIFKYNASISLFNSTKRFNIKKI